MSIEQSCTEAVTEAILLTEKILQALQQGDSELAASYLDDRQVLLEAIPFQQLPQDLPKSLNFAFNHLLDLNEQLVMASEQVQSSIGDKLNTIKKGLSVTKAYQDVDRHQ